MKKTEQKIAEVLFVLFALACFLTAIFTNGNGRVGDSINHFMIAKNAWQDPILFFNHWGKPFFTILASPFAQFGFIGLKIFNVSCALLAAYLAGQTAKLMGMQNWFWTPILVLCGSLYFSIMLSGLTEPLSALMLITAVYYYQQNKDNLALCIVSFLPFVRSEGLVIILVFAAYLLISKNYKKLPWLLLGHAVFSLAGWYFYKDILWVFTKIPYASPNSIYGKGPWSHFIVQLYFCLGPILYGGLILGIFFELKNWFKEGKNVNYKNLFLIDGSILAFVAAHSIFWALGIFNSMGLNRVLVSIFPLMGIVILNGYNQLTNYLPNNFQSKIRYVWYALVLIFPFLKNPAAINFQEACTLSKEQKFVKDFVAPYVLENFPNKRIMAADANIALYANKNMNNPKEWIYAGLGNPLQELNSGDLVIVDPYYFSTESGISLQDIEADTTLSTLTIMESKAGSVKPFAIFQKK